MHVVLLKTGDLRPYLRCQIISRATGQPVNVTGATVTFSMRVIGGTNVINEAAGAVEAGDDGIIRYAWQTSDTATAGSYQGEFFVDAGSGNKFSVPQDGYISIVIREDL